MKKHIQLYTGYDNFINPDGRNIFFGLGVKFEDDDLKYLIGSSAASMK
jgi:phospholipid/cholesterol/gamma-HCH transport system substrate-binding protein